MKENITVREIVSQFLRMNPQYDGLVNTDLICSCEPGELMCSCCGDDEPTACQPGHYAQCCDCSAEECEWRFGRGCMKPGPRPEVEE